jgi:hypothetical protein
MEKSKNNRRFWGNKNGWEVFLSGVARLEFPRINVFFFFWGGTFWVGQLNPIWG